jgi:hypothetical protein
MVIWTLSLIPILDVCLLEEIGMPGLLWRERETAL